MTMDNDKICPCCGKYEFEEPDGYELCPICWWGDDLVQRRNPDYIGGYNRISLNMAKEAYSRGQRVNGPGSACEEYE